MRHLLASLLLSASVFGCGTPPPAKMPVQEPANLDQQLALGESVYGAACASCHGAAGEGKEKAPALVGQKGFDDYKTALEAYTYIKGNMPSDKPGSLSEPEYWAVTAWLAKKNAYPLTLKLDSANAGSVKRP